MLNLLIFLPMIIGVAAIFLDKKILKVYSVFFSFIIFLLSLHLYISANNGHEYISFFTLIPKLNIHYYVGFEGISALLSLLVCFMIFASFVSLKPQDNTTISAIFISTGCAVGLFASRDVALFYMFWDLSFLPILFLNAKNGLVYVSYKFFFYTFLGALLMLAGICIVEVHIYSVTGEFEFTYEAFESVFAISDGYRTLCFALFFMAFAVKSPLFPFHTWAPNMYTKSSTIVSIMLASFKMAPFGFYLFMLGLFKTPMLQNYTLLAFLCIVSAFYSSFLAYRSGNLKEVISYSSIAHIGIILLGIFSSDEIGVSGAIFYMVAHGIITGVLFLLCDEIYNKTGTYDMDKLSNLARLMPLVSFFFGFSLFASISLPLTAGFIGEFLVLLGVFKHNVTFGVLATFMVVLNAIYMLNMFRNVFFKNKRNLVIKDTKLRLGFIVGVSFLCFSILAISIFPNYMLNNIKANINHPFHYKMIKDK